MIQIVDLFSVNSLIILAKSPLITVQSVCDTGVCCSDVKTKPADRQRNAVYLETNPGDGE